MISVLKNFECEVKDDKIIYFIDSDSKFIEQHFNSLENEFLRFGIDLKISFKVLEEIHRTTLMVEHEKKEIDAVYEQKRTLELNKKINFSKSLIVKKLLKFLDYLTRLKKVKITKKQKYLA